MFYLDGISLRKITKELNDILQNSKISKFKKNTDLSFSIYFGKKELIFSCNPNFPICYINHNKEATETESNSIINSLRKYLTNANLINIGQIGFDRILVFNLSKINELGELKKYKIYFEIMGKYSNVIFTDENNIIIDLLKKFSLEENKLRPLLPGVKYLLPIIGEKKINPLNLSNEEFLEFQKNNSLISKIEGIGKIFINSITTFDDFKNLINSSIKPKIFLKNQKIVLATVLDINISRFDEKKEFDSFEDLINYYIEKKQVSQSFESLQKNIIGILDKKIKKDENILKIIKKEIDSTKDMIKIKEQGDILAANLYCIRKGMTNITLLNFYNNQNINIPLIPLLTPKENLDKIYKKYNKEKRKRENNENRQIQLLEELNYLNSTKYFVQNSKTSDNLKNIYEELKNQKIFNIQIKTNKTKQKKTKTISYGIIQFENTQILYGRNNIENDNLTFKIAKKQDLWLHAKDIPGSHVIIKSENSKISENLLIYAAQIAALNSKGNVGDKIKIDYTEKKYVNKPNGAKPGFVTYTNEKSIIIVKQNKILI